MSTQALQDVDHALAELRLSAGYRVTKRDNPHHFGQTHAGRCEAFLQAAIAKLTPVPPVPPTPVPGLAAQAQRVIFCANDPLSAVAAPPGHTIALTADPAYAEGATSSIVSTLRTAGYRVVSWCDCDATPASAAIELQQRLGLDGWIGQAETSVQLHNAYKAGAKVIIGNPNEWTAYERNEATLRIEAGALAVIGEMYRPDPGYSAQGVPISSFCYGIDIGGGAYTPLADYLAVSPPGSVATCCIYHAAGMRDADWRLLA